MDNCELIAAERIASSSKFENFPEIKQKTWNLELGTWNLIELKANLM
jgi:hypothetical protein